MSFPLVRQTRYQLPPAIPILVREDTEELSDNDLPDLPDLEELEELEELENEAQKEESITYEESDESELCPICMKNFNEGTRMKYSLTVCQVAHPLCRSCAINIINLARQRREVPMCPICKTEFRGIENKEEHSFSFSDIRVTQVENNNEKTSDSDNDDSESDEKRVGFSFGSYKKSKRVSRKRSPRRIVSQSYKTNKNKK
jgi:hypothetical protein